MPGQRWLALRHEALPVARRGFLFAITLGEFCRARRSPVTTKSASRAPHSVKLSRRARCRRSDARFPTPCQIAIFSIRSYQLIFVGYKNGRLFGITLVNHFYDAPLARD